MLANVSSQIAQQLLDFFKQYLKGCLIPAFAPIPDEVIRKRLLIDGDGAGDDRRINVLLKSVTKWCNSTGTPEEGYVSPTDPSLGLCHQEFL